MRWQVARYVVRCAFDSDHLIHRGRVALFGRRRFVVCRECAEIVYRLRPPATDEHDGKAKALGEDA